MCFLVDVNEEEKLAVVEEVEQHLARVADDGVRAEVMDVKERELPDDDEWKVAGSVGHEEEIHLQADDSDGE